MSTEKFTIRINDIDVPVRFVRERRRGTRVALGKKEVIMRFPFGMRAAAEAERRDKYINWLKQQAVKHPEAFERYRVADYRDGDTLRVGQRSYTLAITYEDRKTSSARLHSGRIELQLNQDLDARQYSKAIRTLLSRVVAADFLPAVTQRVHELNELHYRQPIKGVRLRYNHSRWGSCSSSGSINLSTRLLFAPPEVVDYVIIHELAHRIEMNHSPRFWAQVARAMPEYERHEAWLKEYGAACDF